MKNHAIVFEPFLVPLPNSAQIKRRLSQNKIIYISHQSEQNLIVKLIHQVTSRRVVVQKEVLESQARYCQHLLKQFIIYD